MSRPVHIFGREFEDFDHLLHVAKPSDRHRYKLYYRGCCSCNVCLCIHADDLMKGTYVAVYDNKIEYNFPIRDHCGNEFDTVSVLYYDRDITKHVNKAGFCEPIGTHCSCCPTCFDICGEAIVLHADAKLKWCLFLNPYRLSSGADLANEAAKRVTGAIIGCLGWCCLPFKLCCAPCLKCLIGSGTKPFIMIGSLDNAEMLARAINKARENAMDRVYGNVKPVKAAFQLEQKVTHTPVQAAAAPVQINMFMAPTQFPQNQVTPLAPAPSAPSYSG